MKLVGFLFDYLVPINQPIIHHAYIIFDDYKVVDFGPYKNYKKKWSSIPLQDCSNQILMPAFVNAHTHLLFSFLRNEKLTSDSFSGWIKDIIKHEKLASDEDFKQGILSGFKDLQDSGVLTIGDISNDDRVLELLFSQKDCLLGGRIYLEYLSFNDEERFKRWNKVEKIYLKFKDKQSQRIQLGFSPHSLYTITDRAFEYFRDQVQKYSPVFNAIHLAESKEEQEFLLNQQGPLYKLMKEYNPNLADSHNLKKLFFNKKTITLSELKKYGILFSKSLLIHCNYLSFNSEDIRLLKENDISIVHCPKSHEFFNFSNNVPLKTLIKEGVNIALGTDSLASRKIKDLNFFKEMKACYDKHNISPRDVVNMATINGAKALHLQGRGIIRKNQPYVLIRLDSESTLKNKEDSIYHYIISYQKKITQFLISYLK